MVPFGSAVGGFPALAWTSVMSIIWAFAAPVDPPRMPRTARQIKRKRALIPVLLQRGDSRVGLSRENVPWGGAHLSSANAILWAFTKRKPEARKPPVPVVQLRAG